MYVILKAFNLMVLLFAKLTQQIKQLLFDQ